MGASGGFGRQWEALRGFVRRWEVFREQKGEFERRSLSFLGVALGTGSAPLPEYERIAARAPNR